MKKVYKKARCTLDWHKWVTLKTDGSGNPRRRKCSYCNRLEYWSSYDKIWLKSPFQ